MTSVDYYQTILEHADAKDIPLDPNPSHVSDTYAKAVILKSFVGGGNPLVEFVFAETLPEFHAVLRRMGGAHQAQTVVGFINRTRELYISVFQDGRRYEFDVAQGREAHSKLMEWIL